jgi:hypothetical protein
LTETSASAVPTAKDRGDARDRPRVVQAARSVTTTKGELRDGSVSMAGLRTILRGVRYAKMSLAAMRSSRRWWSRRRRPGPPARQDEVRVVDGRIVALQEWDCDWLVVLAATCRSSSQLGEPGIKGQ